MEEVTERKRVMTASICWGATDSFLRQRGIHLDQYVCITSNAVMRVFDRSVLYGNN